MSLEGHLRSSHMRRACDPSSCNFLLDKPTRCSCYGSLRWVRPKRRDPEVCGGAIFHSVALSRPEPVNFCSSPTWNSAVTICVDQLCHCSNLFNRQMCDGA